MPLKISCPGCKATLQLRPEYAGKKIRCPRCSEVITVPPGSAAEVVEVQPIEDEGITLQQPLARDKVPPVPKRRHRDEEDDPKAREDDQEGPQYHPCPQCGARGATRVLWTPWGSFYGLALFTHVRCPECGSAYNGNTGRSNLVPAIVFVTVPALGLIAILGFLAYMLLPYFR